MLYKLNNKLFVASLDWSITNEDLKTLFGEAGVVVSAQVIIDHMTNRSRGFGFVEMATPEEAQTAIQKFNQFEVKGRKLVVNLARPREN